MTQIELRLITKSQLELDLRKLGVEPGQILMLHASVKAIGWIVGGPDVVLDALLEVLSPSGTLMMYVGWEEDIEDFFSWSPEHQAAYLAECPPFQPATSRAHRKWSILTEYLRTRPGAMRSTNPGASIAAIGENAGWLTENHPLQYGYGPGSPLAKLCQAGGKVLLLGAPLDTVTLLHYSEHMANLPDKRTVRYQVPIIQEGQKIWLDVEEFDTGIGVADWDRGDYFPVIVSDFLMAGKGRSGKIGAAQSYLFEADELHNYAVRWLENKFSSRFN